MTCPSCGAQTTGRFCAECGVPVDRALCAGCGSALTPGARFCHRCGTAVGAAPRQAGTASALPWAVAGIALLALIALVAGRNFGARRGGTLDAPRNAIAQPGLDDGGPTAGAPFANGGAGMAPGRAPDISSMTPAERAARLFDRVMRLASEGKPDSVQLFAPMAIQAYQMLDSLGADDRYDMGRLGEVLGDADLAAAQADTILIRQPTHLLGLLLAERAAVLKGDSAARRQFAKRFLAAEPGERRRNLPEYERHRAEIADAIAQARRTS